MIKHKYLVLFLAVSTVLMFGISGNTSANHTWFNRIVDTNANINSYPDEFRSHDLGGSGINHKRCDLSGGSGTFTTAPFGWGSRFQSSSTASWPVAPGSDTEAAQANFGGHNCLANMDKNDTHTPFDFSGGTPQSPTYSQLELRNRTVLRRDIWNVLGGGNYTIAVSKDGNNVANHGLTIGNLPNGQYIVNWDQSGRVNDEFYTAPVAVPFIVQNLSNLVAAGTYSITVGIRTRPVVEHANGTLQCRAADANGNYPIATNSAGSNCPEHVAPVTLLLTIAGGHIQGQHVFTNGATPADNSPGMSATVDSVTTPPTTRTTRQFAGSNEFKVPVGDRTISSGSSITAGGTTYTYIGYSACLKNTGCHPTGSTTANTSTSNGTTKININRTNPQQPPPLPVLADDWWDVWFRYEPSAAGGNMPQGNFQVTCDTIRGWGYDPDFNDSIFIRVYINGIQQGPLITGDEPTPSWAPSNVPNNRGFTFDVPDTYKDADGFTVTIDFRNRSPAGTYGPTAGPDYTLSKSISGPCTLPTTCPSFASPFTRTVDLPAAGIPANEGTSASGTTASGTDSGWSWTESGWQPSNPGITTTSQTNTRNGIRTRTVERTVTYYVYYRNSDGSIASTIDQVLDILWRTSPTSGEMTPVVTGTGTNSKVTLNYTTHFNNYPYDNHQPEVKYRLRYRKFTVRQTKNQRATASQSITRTRSAGRPDNPFTPINEYRAPGAWSSPSWPSAPSPSWSDTSSWSPTIPANNATSGYVGTQVSGTYWTNPQYYYNATQMFMPYCFPRSVTINGGSPNLDSPAFNDYEDPTSLNYSAGLNVQFFLEYGTTAQKKLRKPMNVNNLQIGGNWYTQDYTGATLPLPRPNLPQTSNEMVKSHNLTETAATTGSIGVAKLPGSKNLTAAFTATIPPLQPGTKGCFSLNAPRSQANIDPSGNILATSPYATLVLTRSASLPKNGTPNPQCGPALHNKPYMKVFGGSVVAGRGFAVDGTCTVQSGAPEIRTYARYNGGNSYGSSVEYAVQVLSGTGGDGQIVGNATDSGFFSASLRLPNTTGYLTIANDGFSSSNWNGGYGTSGCVPDYFDEKAQFTRFPTGSPNVSSLSPGVVDLASPSIMSGVQYVTSTGNITLRNSAAVTDKRVTIYVDGNVTIDSNIIYSGTYAYNPTSPTAYQSIPYVTVIARGNIFIERNVSTVSGLLVAQPSPSNPTGTGNVYTCSQNGAQVAVGERFYLCNGSIGTTPVGMATMYAECNGGTIVGAATGSPLNIVGAIIARQVNFDRSNGTLRCAKTALPEGYTSGTVAEKFLFTAEMTLGQPVFRPKAGTSSNDFGNVNSYQALPPIF